MLSLCMLDLGVLELGLRISNFQPWTLHVFTSDVWILRFWVVHFLRWGLRIAEFRCWNLGSWRSGVGVPFLDLVFATRGFGFPTLHLRF